MIRFDVSSLVKAQIGASLALNVHTGPQRLTELELNFLRGTLQVVRVQEGLLVQGTVKSALGLECVRCLEPFVLPITLELEETFRLPGTGPKSEMPYAVNNDGWIDLAPLLREQAWLAIPMKPLCDPECKGLCSQCGVNRNLESCTCEEERIDPRLAVLKDLL
jgi:uncharacterized protein